MTKVASGSHTGQIHATEPTSHDRSSYFRTLNPRHAVQGFGTTARNASAGSGTVHGARNVSGSHIGSHRGWR